MSLTVEFRIESTFHEHMSLQRRKDVFVLSATSYGRYVDVGTTSLLAVTILFQKITTTYFLCSIFSKAFDFMNFLSPVLS